MGDEAVILFDDLPAAIKAAPRYLPSPTVEQFICAARQGPLAEMRLLMLEGSRGEGKTTGGIMACGAIAERVLAELPNPRSLLPIRVGVVRDTWANLERTTLESFREAAAQGLPIEVTHGGHQAVLRGPGGAELVHFWFFGLDRPDDADKLQGFQCAILWIEEAAPAAGIASGVPEEALTLGNTSVRQRGVPKRIFLTHNPPDEDHWIVKIEAALERRQIRGVKVARWSIPPGEKAEHFTRLAESAWAVGALEEAEAWRQAADEFSLYRERMRGILEEGGRGDLVSRLVSGQRGMVTVGEAVVPNFKGQTHIYQEDGKPASIPLYRQLPVQRWWDSGTPNLHPAIVWAQVGPSPDAPAWVNILGSRTGENVGITEFIFEQVIPFEQEYGLRPEERPRMTKPPPAGQPVPAFGGAGTVTTGRGRRDMQFRDIGDPACLIPEGTSSQRTVALQIQELLQTSFEPGPQDWPSRREALHTGFGRNARGRPVILIDPTENELLIKALGGRFHYPKDSTGRIIGTIKAAKRVSGMYSHTVDCVAYGLAVNFPAHDAYRRPAPKMPDRRVSGWMAH